MTYLPKVSPTQPAPSASIFSPLCHGSTSSNLGYLQEGDRKTQIVAKHSPHLGSQRLTYLLSLWLMHLPTPARTYPHVRDLLPHIQGLLGLQENVLSSAFLILRQYIPQILIEHLLCAGTEL